MSIHRTQHHRLETGDDYTRLYVYEAKTRYCTRAIDEADDLTIPAEGDHLLEATVEGDLSDGAIHSLESEPVTDGVDRREITYLAVEGDLEGFGDQQGIISESSV